MCAAVAEQELVAVGQLAVKTGVNALLRDAQRAGRAAGAADILDDDLLTDALAHRRRQDPRHHVDRAAGRKGTTMVTGRVGQSLGESCAWTELAQVSATAIAAIVLSMATSVSPR